MNDDLRRVVNHQSHNPTMLQIQDLVNHDLINVIWTNSAIAY